MLLEEQLPEVPLTLTLALTLALALTLTLTLTRRGGARPHRAAERAVHRRLALSRAHLRYGARVPLKPYPYPYPYP